MVKGFLGFSPWRKLAGAGLLYWLKGKVGAVALCFVRGVSAREVLDRPGCCLGGSRELHSRAASGTGAGYKIARASCGG